MCDVANDSLGTESEAIVVVHKGNQSYFCDCLECARRCNPGVRMIVIGTHNPLISDSNTLFVDISKAEATSFSEIYKHFSGNSYSYELFCFERWFIILSVMRQCGIKRACYLDSDVLLDDVSKELRSSEYLFTFDSGHCSFFTDSQLSNLCDYIVNCYSDERELRYLESVWKNRKACGLSAGVSDMTLIRRFALLECENAVDLSIARNGSVYDHNVNLSDGYFLAHEGKKAIVGYQGHLHFVDHTTFSLVRAKGVHFQGLAKKYMQVVSRLETSEFPQLFNYSDCEWIPFSWRTKANEPLTMRIDSFSDKVAKKLKAINERVKMGIQDD